MVKKSTLIRGVAAVSLWCLISCSQGPTETPASAIRKSGDASGIDWYQGDVNAAFTVAKAERKPILLYWGAIWCPPCLQLKATVFSRPEFIAKTRQFIPVYLDGDDAGAQKWGEQFRVSGYPTLVVLDADQHERMRIAGGLDLNQYATVLDTALADLQPADTLLNAASAGNILNAGQCRRLAFNSWELDAEADAAANAKLAQQLTAAAERCSVAPPQERARLRVVAANYAALAESDSLASDHLPSPALRSQLAALDKTLTNPDIASEMADVLQYLDNSVFLAVKGGDDSARWLTHYVKVMDATAGDPNYAEADQLSAIYAKLRAIKTVNGAIPTGVGRAARARVAATLGNSQTPDVRSGIVDMGVAILAMLGQSEQAYKILLVELNKTATPYFYKADLGRLAENLGRKDEALKWYADAFAEARGLATRFQWGQLYATSVLRLKPDDEQLIRSVTEQALAELDGPDRIYRRARMRLDRLDKALRKWNSDTKGVHHDVIIALRERMQQICEKIPKTEPALASCNTFLANA